MIETGVMTGIVATTEIEEMTVEMAIAAMTRKMIVIRIGGMTEEVLKRRRVIGMGRRREALRKL